VTLLSVVEDREKGFTLLVAEGESVAGPILEMKRTAVSFSIGARGFVEAWSSRGPAHHCAVGVGHSSGHLRKVRSDGGSAFHQVC